MTVKKQNGAQEQQCTQQEKATLLTNKQIAEEESKHEKTQDELDYEAGYYACCFRSH